MRYDTLRSAHNDHGEDELNTPPRQSARKATTEAIQHAAGLETVSRQCEDLYRDIMESVSDIIVVVDKAGNILDANRMAEETTGYSHEELPQKNLFRDLIVQEDRAAARRALRSIAVGRDVRLELRWRAKNGDIVYLEANSHTCHSMNKENKAVRILCVLRNIAERRTAEKALAESERWHRQMFDKATEGVWVIDTASNITYTNHRIAEMLGYSEEEISTQEVFVPMDKDSKMLARQVLSQCKLGSSKPVEIELRHRNGSPVFTMVHSAPLINDKGEYIGSVGFVSDITEQKRLAKQLHRAQRLEAIGRMAGGVAHEFNNLLMGVSGFAEALQMKLGENHPEKETIDGLLHCVDSASLLVGQLLAFGRRQEIDARPVELNELTASTTSLLQRLIGSPVTIKLNLSPQRTVARVDPSHIEQVLVNLALNARDAMPRGGTITIGVANRSIEAGDKSVPVDLEPGDYTELSVSDTGSGMDESTIDHVFEPFFTTKNREKGTGLGLAVAHGIVKQHKGSITVTSKPGEGATFRVYLPAAPVDSLEP
ncbi:MAG: PAS domain S-box protein [Armatimonadetes bacterium]|nr:PAS domain S-box protein [Armatimonadota bacterium]